MQRTGFRGWFVAGSVAAVIASCGPTGMEMIGDAMVDVGTRLRDGGDALTPDASAQDCATSCSGGGVLRVMTADTDPAQLLTGVVRGGAAQEVVSGPFVLTDLQADPVQYDLYLAAAGSTCTSTSASADFVAQTSDATGMHIVVAAGETLCAAVSGGQSSDRLRWAGFRPYD